MKNKIKYIIILLLIVTNVFSQSNEDRYIRLSQFESEEFLKTPLKSGNSYLIHQDKKEAKSLEIRKYKNGKKHGEWLTFLKTIGTIDLVNVCNYKNGIKDGYFFNTDNHTYKEEGYYKNDEKQGTWLIYREERKESYTYKNGKKHGVSRIEEKDYIEEGRYKGDKKHGIWTTKDNELSLFDEKGIAYILVTKGIYNKGKLVKKEEIKEYNNVIEN